MNNPGNIEKRIKRHIIGKIRSFFISTAPGIERLCQKEILTLGLTGSDATLLKGGVALNARVHECYLTNLKLRLANRILMRVEDFRATNFRQLKKNIADLPWELYLQENAVCEISVTSRHSRLFHTDAIADQFKEGLEKRGCFAHFKPGDKEGTPRFPQQVFIRAVDDRFSVSIDSSGDLLHKRGLKTHGGKAPIRETTAAAILSLAGYQKGVPLLDPMCGSGTFSLEGAMVTNRIPAGWYRNFAFMGWPCFKNSRWKHIRREAKKRISPSVEPAVFASDRDQASCLALKKTVREKDLAGTISVHRKDFFDLLPSDIKKSLKGAPRGLVVINPPYGRRLETGADSEKLFVEICHKLQRDFRGWKLALIAPNRNLVKKVPFSVVSHALFHGGLNLTLLTGKIA